MEILKENFLIDDQKNKEYGYVFEIVIFLEEVMQYKKINCLVTEINVLLASVVELWVFGYLGQKKVERREAVV